MAPSEHRPVSGLAGAERVGAAGRVRAHRPRPRHPAAGRPQGILMAREKRPPQSDSGAHGASLGTGPEESDELFRQLPDPAARDSLSRTYQPLAEYLARRFYGRGEPLEDLIQVASIGLLKAIDR